MTYEEWIQKRETEKSIENHLEKMRQLAFKIEQSKESAHSRPTVSIVDADN